MSLLHFINLQRHNFSQNKDENVHRCAIRGELLERERDSFGILYTGYLLSIVKIKREIERGKKRERERKEQGQKLSIRT